MMRRYPAYRDSGVEWLGEVPQRWEVTRLRSVVNLNPSKSEIASMERKAEVTFLPMEAISEDGDVNTEYTRELSAVEIGYTFLREGDVAFAKITPCFENGKRARMRGLRNGVAFGTTELTVLRPKVVQVTSDFIFWLLSSPDFRRLGEAHMYGAGGQKRVPDSFVRNLPIALPSLVEQTAMTAFLDRETAKIDALVDEQRRLITLLREKRQAVISHAVTKGLNPAVPMKPSGVDWLGDVPEGWEVARIGRYSDILPGYAFQSDQFSDDDRDTPLLRGANVGVGELRWDDTVYWPRKADDGLDRWELAAGDLVIGMDRPWISSGTRVAIVKDHDLPCLLLQRVAAIRTDSRLDRRYLMLHLASDRFRDTLAPDTTGVSVPHISPGQIANFVISVPSREEQLDIVNFIEAEEGKVRGMLDVAEAAIALLQERRAALISAAVTGKIDVRDLASVETEAA